VKYTVGVNNTGYTNLGNIGFKNYSYALGTLKRDTIYNGINRIGIVESIASVNTFGVYELKFTILADSINYLWRIEHTGNGRIDSWNFDYITSSLPSATLFPKISKYKIADTTQTIVSSFQCSDEVITVANYVNRNKYLDVTSTLQITTETPGEIAASSSVGPTRNNKIKPDIAATGATVLASAAMAMLPGLISGAPSVVAQGGYHITAGGTSASSPVVAGLAALYLQKNPSATNIQIKQAITNCAYTDAFVSLPVPNYRWGYGKLDGFHALTCGMVVTNIEVNSSSVINVYPNPISNEANILFKDDQLRTLKLINSVGQIVFIEKVKSNTYKLVCKDLTPGMYILVSEEKDAINKIKIVVL
jgi:subtilisin family serine protease